MKEHVYLAKRKRIVRQSFFIWFFAVVQIGLNIYAFADGATNSLIVAMLFFNILFSLMTIPAVFLFYRYYNHSIRNKFVVTYNSLKLIDLKTGHITEIKSTDIEKIYLVENLATSELPWCFHEYFEIVDSKQNKILVTSYVMDIYELWLDSLARRVSSNKLVRQKKLYPII